MHTRSFFGLPAAAAVIVGLLAPDPITGLLGAGSAVAAQGGCAQPVTSGASPVATDCLFILRAAVGSATCTKPCLCQPKGSAPTRAGDALLCLLVSVGSPSTVDCPCGDPDVQSSDYLFDPDTDIADPNLRPKFVSTDYLGAFSQDRDPSLGDWTEGWTVELHGNHTVWEPATGGTLNGATPAADSACPAGTTDFGDTALPAGFPGTMDKCRLPQRFATMGGTLTLTNDNVYYLSNVGNQGTLIGNGDSAMRLPSDVGGTVANSQLVIEPGTLILGDVSRNLIVTRGAKVFSNGTAEDPVVMESEEQFNAWVSGGNGTALRRGWGGFIVTGFGVINTCNDATYCDNQVEGINGIVRYGGVSGTPGTANWDAGSITYTVIGHPGFDIDGLGNDTNGLTLYGIGYATEVSHVQVNMSGDDGIEVFGGNVVVDHAVATGAADDSFDTDFGFLGGFQFGVVKQFSDEADKGFEMDNTFATVAFTTFTPVSEPNMVNLTVISSNAASGTPATVNLRTSTGANFWNVILAGDPEAGAIVDSNSTVSTRGGVLTDPEDGVLKIHNSVAWTDGAAAEFSNANTTTWFNALGGNNQVGDPGIDAATGYPDQTP